MPRKNKIQEPTTPQELSKQNDKDVQNPAIRKYHVNMDSKSIVGLKKRRLFLRIALGALLAILVVILSVVYFCKRAARKILHPKTKRKALHTWPDAYQIPYENISFQTEDHVTLKGWFIASGR